METFPITYKVKTASEQEICSHLKVCDNNFLPPLSGRVDIEEYAKKIVNRATTFEAWSGTILIGLVAVYIDATNCSGFITNVSVIKKYARLGIAAELTGKCIEYIRQNNFKDLKLEVHKNNTNAINLYKKFNFIKYDSRVDLDLMKLEIK